MLCWFIALWIVFFWFEKNYSFSHIPFGGRPRSFTCGRDMELLFCACCSCCPLLRFLHILDKKTTAVHCWNRCHFITLCLYTVYTYTQCVYIYIGLLYIYLNIHTHRHVYINSIYPQHAYIPTHTLSGTHKHKYSTYTSVYIRTHTLMFTHMFRHTHTPWFKRWWVWQGREEAPALRGPPGTLQLACSNCIAQGAMERMGRELQYQASWLEPFQWSTWHGRDSASQSQVCVSWCCEN